MKDKLTLEDGREFSAEVDEQQLRQLLHTKETPKVAFDGNVIADDKDGFIEKAFNTPLPQPPLSK